MDMQLVDAQRLFAAAGYYDGGLDGDWGPKTKEAVDRLLGKHRSLCTQDPVNWNNSRRTVAAAQIVLHFAGFEPGAIDGYFGNNTLEAYRAWDHESITGHEEKIDRTPIRDTSGVKLEGIPYQSEVKEYYGDPADGEIAPRLVMVDLPYPLKLDWDLNTTVTRMSLHDKAADSAYKALEEIKKAYGMSQLDELGLTRFAGSYNHRRMRGGSSWSMHAYGCAIDFFAQPNGLRMRCPQALFCKDIYEVFFDIWEQHGWISLGREIGRDWMHIQRAKLD